MTLTPDGVECSPLRPSRSAMRVQLSRSGKTKTMHYNVRERKGERERGREGERERGRDGRSELRGFVY